MGALDWLVEQLPIGPGLVKKHGRIDVNYADPRRTDPSLTIPAPHGYTHGVDGGDPVQLAMTQVTDLVSTLGDKVDDDDPRLTDDRDPTAHHATHEDGGSDELTLAQSQISGLVTDLSDINTTLDGLDAAIAVAVEAAVADIIPPWTEADIGRSLTVIADATLGWVNAGALVPYIYDSVADYDNASTYDEGYY